MRPSASQPDLLDWHPPVTTVAFHPREVQAGTVAGRVARAVAATLAGAGKSREELAQAMSAYLGRRVSANMLNGYASQGREEHVISVERMVALLHATGDRRLLEALAEPFGWAVIERRFLPLIELAAVREREDDLGRQAEALRRQARRGGLI